MKKLFCILLSVLMCATVLCACAETEDIREGSMFDEPLFPTQTQTTEDTKTQSQEETQPHGQGADLLTLDMDSVTLTAIGETAVIREGDDGSIHWYTEDSSVVGVSAGVVYGFIYWVITLL